MTAKLNLLTGTLEEIENLLINDVLSSRGVAFRLVNTYSIGLATIDKDYRAILFGPGRNVIDGKPIAIIMNTFNASHNYYQVRGIDLFKAILKKTNSEPYSHAFFGSTDEVLSKMVSNAIEEFPKLDIALVCNPGKIELSDEFLNNYLAKIESSKANIVWIGLGTPIQDFVAEYFAKKSDKVFISIGAAFDFYSGVKRESPGYLNHVGLEWLFRLIAEPKRLWKRYLFVSPIGLISALVNRFAQK